MGVRAFDDPKGIVDGEPLLRRSEKAVGYGLESVGATVEIP
jgi:hypothetical protein